MCGWRCGSSATSMPAYHSALCSDRQFCGTCRAYAHTSRGEGVVVAAWSSLAPSCTRLLSRFFSLRVWTNRAALHGYHALVHALRVWLHVNTTVRGLDGLGLADLAAYGGTSDHLRTVRPNSRRVVPSYR